MAFAELPSRVVADILFVGRSGGLVKTLGGFRKSHHTVPDAANATTQAFLAKICEAELSEEAEKLFQDVRTGLGYKRKDVSLSVTPPTATLAAKDFEVEIAYALEESEPSRYAVTMALRGLRSAEMAGSDAVATVFAGKFSEISFALKKGVRVEAVVDAIEAIDGEGGMSVTYPSDCGECTIRVEGVEPEVRCTGSTLEMVFARGGSPRELIEAFATVRGAFQISKVLAGLIG
jgi:hypothetical protein